VNCYHGYYPFIPGISERAYTDEELRRLDAEEAFRREFKGKRYNAYEARQKQRKMETSMRAQRQKARFLEEGGAAKADIIAAKARYQGQLAEYRQFSDAMKLKPHMERVYIDGLGRVAGGVRARIYPNMLHAPFMKGTVLAKKGEAFLDALKRSRGSKAHVNKMRLYAEATEFVENLDLDRAFSYNGEKDRIEFNPSHDQFNRYNINFALAHELSHRMDILEYGAYKNPAFGEAIEEAKAYVREHREELQKLFNEGGKYCNDIAFSDIISALSDNAIIVFAGHDSWNSEKARLEIFANLSVIDILGSESAKEPVLRKLMDVYRKMVE